jgi:hypothetical protein
MPFGGSNIDPGFQDLENACLGARN